MRLIDADKLKEHIDKLPALPDGNFAGNHSALKALINMQPTIEQPTNCSEFPNNSDTISRQAAIDAFDGVKVDEENCTEYDIGYNDGIDFAISKLSVLPPAQPEKLTDIEQRIFLAAMSKEEKVCREVDKEPSDADCINLMRVCKSIERKVKGALWT